MIINIADADEEYRNGLFEYVKRNKFPVVIIVKNTASSEPQIEEFVDRIDKLCDEKCVRGLMFDFESKSDMAILESLNLNPNLNVIPVVYIYKEGQLICMSRITYIDTITKVMNNI